MNQFDRRTRQMLDGPVVPTLLKMAIPNALVMFAQLAIALVEIYFLARLGVDVLAGVPLVFPVLAWVGAAEATASSPTSWYGALWCWPSRWAC
jgi:Na+-driven multidrug efflux pump